MLTEEEYFLAIFSHSLGCSLNKMLLTKEKNDNDDSYNAEVEKKEVLVLELGEGLEKNTEKDEDGCDQELSEEDRVDSFDKFSA